MITAEASRMLVDEVDEELSRGITLAYDGPGLREEICEVVQLRHSITALRMTGYLGAHGIVGGNPDQSALVNQVRRATASVDAVEAVVIEVVGRCSFGPLSDLPVKAIEDCRREMPRFRGYLEKRLTDQAAREVPDRHRIAEDILRVPEDQSQRNAWSFSRRPLGCSRHGAAARDRREGSGARIEWLGFLADSQEEVGHGGREGDVDDEPGRPGRRVVHRNFGTIGTGGLKTRRSLAHEAVPALALPAGTGHRVRPSDEHDVPATSRSAGGGGVLPVAVHDLGLNRHTLDTKPAQPQALQPDAGAVVDHQGGYDAPDPASVGGGVGPMIGEDAEIQVSGRYEACKEKRGKDHKLDQAPGQANQQALAPGVRGRLSWLSVHRIAEPPPARLGPVPGIKGPRTGTRYRFRRVVCVFQRRFGKTGICQDNLSAGNLRYAFRLPSALLL